MVLVQVFCDVFAVTPLIIYSIWAMVIGTIDDPLTLSQLAFVRITTNILYYFQFVVSLNDIINISIRFIFFIYY